MYESKGKSLLRSFAEYRDLGSRNLSGSAGDTVLAVKKAVRLRCHPDRLHRVRFRDWSDDEHSALVDMAKE
eukprot:5193925-Alexandrium_andersonii.AAC.1